MAGKEALEQNYDEEAKKCRCLEVMQHAIAITVILYSESLLILHLVWSF